MPSRGGEKGEHVAGLESPRFFSLAIDPRHPEVVYAGTAGQGAFRSPPGIPASRTGAVQVNPRHPQIWYVGTEGAGVFRSLDGGDSWLSVNTGLDDLHVYGLAMDLSSPDTLYASTTSSVFMTRTGGQ